MNPKLTTTTALTMGAGPVKDRNEPFKWPGQDSWRTSVYRCPVCNEPLRYVMENGECSLWCAFGPCRSKAANDGAEALTEALAFSALRDKTDQEWIEEKDEEDA